MVENGEGDAAAGGSEALAAQIAMNASGLSEEAREYLKKQSRLADLQIDTLEKKDEFELSHLRFRRFSDYARFALEIAVGLVVLLIVLGLGTMVWNASRDHDLVVDAFSVPPDIAQTGMTGAALANRMLDRMGTMDRSAFSFAGDFSAYHANAREDVRVEIPDTGVSIGELNTYLRAWLGQETHVSGELVRTPKGLGLAVRYGNNPGVTTEGSSADLNTLIQKSAETVFRAGQPLRFADYLSSHGRIAEARAIAEAETHVGDDAHRAQAYVSLGVNDYWRGDSRALATDGRAAVRLDPNNWTAWYMLEAYSNNLDREEENLKVTQTMLRLAKEGHLKSQDNNLTRTLPTEVQATIDILQGAFKDAIDFCETTKGHGIATCSRGSLIGDYASAHDIAMARFQLADSPTIRSNGAIDLDLMFSAVQIAFSANDFPQTLALSKKAEAASADPASALDRDVFLRPFEAEALARSGDIAGGRKMAASLPDDCDICLLARGRVEMVAHNWAGAVHWFSVVSARAPDIPLADTYWGQMLMQKGDFDDAIAKFASANQKGPHFADPLEMWGEALIAKNRSDLALAKFAEATKYAPKWGRLHLKWSEALLWSGDKDGAAKQFAVAAKLDLSPADTVVLRREGQLVR